MVQNRAEQGWAGLGWVLGGSWIPKGMEDDTGIQEDGAELLVPLTCCVTPGCRSPSLCLRRCPTSPRRKRAQEVGGGGCREDFLVFKDEPSVSHCNP